MATFYAGDMPSAGDMTDATTHAGASVFNSVVQSVGTSTTTRTKLAADSERYDDGYHDTVTNNTRLTAPYDGTYRISGSVSFASNATGNRLCEFIINNTDIIAWYQDIGKTVTQIDSGTITIDLAAGEYVEIQVRQNSGGNLDIQMRDFSIELIRRTDI